MKLKLTRPCELPRVIFKYLEISEHTDEQTYFSIPVKIVKTQL